MQYFKHFGTMRHDIKIKRVIAKYGLEGYGLYNLTLESITESLSTASPLPDLQETCEDIAEFYNGNTAKINEMMNFMVNQGLFDLEDMSGRIVCNKLYKFLDTSQTRSTELRAMIKGFKAVSKPQIEDKSDTVTDSHVQSGNVCAESDRIEVEKKKKRKELEENKNKEGNKSPSRAKFIKPTIDELQEYCKEKDYTVDCTKFINHYESNGWKVGKNKMISWKHALGTWNSNPFDKPEKKDNFKRGGINFEL